MLMSHFCYSYIQKASDVAEMVFSKILIKSLNLAEKPITSKKLVEKLSPETPLFSCMRGRMDIEDIGKEAQIHWNGPPLARADKLGEAALDRIFGKGRWDFTTVANRAESTVTKRLREEEASVPFFN